MEPLPSHHPDAAHLLDYASGNQAGAVSLAIASHVTLCPACRREVERLEAVGGASFEALPDVAPAPATLEAVLKRLDAPASAKPAPANDTDDEESARLPRPLRRALGMPLPNLRWRRLGGFAVHKLKGVAEPYRAYLIRSAGHVDLARHTHGGEEFTLVLEGGFTDGDRHFIRGDVELADAGLHHRPIADAEGCLALAVTEGPLRFDDWPAGLVGRWFGI